MASSSRRRSTAGFSLAEALVALAVASFLVAVLARFVVGVRSNASEIRQQLAMSILGNELLERYATSNLQPGRIDGHSGALAWHINVSPIAYSAQAQSVSQEKPAEDAQPAPIKLGLSQSLAPTSPGAKPPPKMVWNPYHVTVAITSPSGRSYAIDTVRIGQQPVEGAEADKLR